MCSSSGLSHGGCKASVIHCVSDTPYFCAGQRSVPAASRRLGHPAGRFALLTQIHALARISDASGHCVKQRELRDPATQTLSASHLAQLTYVDSYSHYEKHFKRGECLFDEVSTAHRSPWMLPEVLLLPLASQGPDPHVSAARTGKAAQTQLNTWSAGQQAPVCSVNPSRCPSFGPTAVTRGNGQPNHAVPEQC